MYHDTQAHEKKSRHEHQVKQKTCAGEGLFTVIIYQNKGHKPSQESTGKSQAIGKQHQTGQRPKQPKTIAEVKRSEYLSETNT